MTRRRTPRRNAAMSVARSLALALVLALSLGLSSAAHALAVRITSHTLGGSGAGTDTDLNNFYNAQAGVSSSVFARPITAAVLAGVDLLVVMVPETAFSSPEVTAMSAFLGGGGRILFIGDNFNAVPTQNARINAALSALGSSMSLVSPPVSDGGFNDATVANGQILPHPLTTGVSLFYYAAPSGVAGIAGGNRVFLMTDLATAFVGAEAVGGGSVVLAGDINIVNPLTGSFGAPIVNDNDVFFFNVLTTPSVPTRALTWGGIKATYR